MTGVEFHRRGGRAGRGSHDRHDAARSEALPRARAAESHAPVDRASSPACSPASRWGCSSARAAAVLQPVADLYIRGMQMTVLPYLVLTLVGGLGQLDPAHRAAAGPAGGRAARVC